MPYRRRIHIAAHTPRRIRAEPMTQPETDPPIDVDGFRALMRDSGMEEIVEPTLELYAQEATRLFADLSAAVASGDLHRVRSLAHLLRGSAGNIRAVALSEILQTIESAAQDRDLDTVAGLFERVREEHESVMAHLARISPQEQRAPPVTGEAPSP
jgi:HPt (histidine-containing phosphotransfer) domain-containing protein